MTRRYLFPAMGIALGNLAALGLMVGWVGASRAYSVGAHTLLRDHLLPVTLTLAGTAILAFLLGRTLGSWHEVALVMGLAVAADVVAAFAVTLVFDEMRRVAAFALPRAIFTEMVGGLQILAMAGGAAIGWAVGNARSRDIARR